MTQTSPGQPATVIAAPQIFYAPAPPTNVLAVLALVGSLIGFHLVGVIMGHIALAQIKRTGESGRSLAVAGLIIGYLFLGGAVLALLIWLLIGAFAFIAALMVAGTSGVYYD